MITDLSKGTELVEVAEHIMSEFNAPFVVKGQEFYVTASAGIAVFPQDGADAETIIKSADIAMYHAKEKGKNQYILCTSDLKEEANQKIKLTNNLYRAIERNELVLHYQPQIDLQTNKIIGVEALIRWNHPELGMVPPKMFIPLAEPSGLIYSIGEWTINTACRQNKIWQDMGLPHLRMAVNISVNQFRNPNLFDQVGSALRETGLDPKYLELEITESIAIREEDYVISVLDHLKELGVSISIDDFGTEYSSLSRLTMLPVDRLKIDIQFIRGIEDSYKDKAITDSIINLAKNLGLKVIAEGVETKGQLDFLQMQTCDEVQGFYYYKPMTVDQIEALLRKGTTIVGGNTDDK
jgi:EAL domain-containing protein (putative c-di-GMP-specific phosphodiesterase class I)